MAFDEGLPIRRAIDRFLRNHSVSIEVSLTFDNIETIKRAVEIGSGVAILPEPTLSAELRNRSLVAVSIKNDAEPLIRPLAIIHRKNRALSPVGLRFLKRLLEDAGAVQTPSKIPELAAGFKAVSAEKPLLGTEVNGRVM